MTYDEIITALKNPDTLADGLLELDTLHKTTETELAGLREAANTSEKRIRDLQDSNMKLFLRITGETTAEEHKPETYEEKLKAIKEAEYGNYNKH